MVKINIKLIEMREKVKEELEYIPRGNFYQNMLRQMYWTIRLISLGKKVKDKKEYPDDKNKILKSAIENIKQYTIKKGVEFKPNYDRNYFKI